MKTFIALSVVALLWSMNEHAMAQSSQDPSQGSQTAATAESERPRTEVEKLIEEAEKHGELILGASLGNCTGVPINGLEPGCALELPIPAYPRIARAGKASGIVNVKVVVGFDGTVNAASAVKGNPLLLATSVKAARESRFVPWKFKGRPIRVVVVIVYNFVVQ